MSMAVALATKMRCIRESNQIALDLTLNSKKILKISEYQAAHDLNNIADDDPQHDQKEEIRDQLARLEADLNNAIAYLNARNKAITELEKSMDKLIDSEIKEFEIK